MGKLVLILALLLGAGALTWKYLCKDCHPPSPPNLTDEWWGPKQLIGKVDHTIRPFKVKFTEEMIKDLRSRLDNHRPLTPPLEGTALEYGMNSNQLEEILKYWSKSYPFEKREQYMNQFPQFKTNIQGLDIHFIRVKPEVKPGVTVVPLLLLHGWPGSVREFLEVIPLLTRPRTGHNVVFEVVAPSLPGYGFSDPAVRPGLGAAQMGVIARNLMKRLGHQRFYVQGGDWGAVIGAAMATLYPEEVVGFHSNMAYVNNLCTMLKTLIGSIMPSLIVEEHLADRMYPLGTWLSYVMEEFGYMHLQSTKPDTVGVGVSDSPAGLAAYILEKFATWTVRGTKALPAHLNRDALIDNLMMYWVPNSVTTSMRLYAETMSSKYRAMKLDDIKTPVPTWVLQAKHELFYQPASILRTKYTNLLNTTVLDHGGHFIAFEQPAILAQDVFTAVTEFRRWHDEQSKAKTEL
ncbi:juvenile hormone epoxide hydrolase [Plutella xylostella]|uniref:juvenile hormone epoxide hydrolase n=1 Tax=Plutella xylostella TaxID=51655 RepID=UPI00203271F5|nr:juvenile hormone epoxide hydrolase [Plutella xylostella]